jgi:hypothetical protein
MAVLFFLIPGELQSLLCGLVALLEPVHDRLDRLHKFALLGVRLQFHGHDAIDLEIVVVSGGVELGAEVVDEIGVAHVCQLGGRVVGLERLEHVLRVVHEVQHVGRVLAGMGTIQPGESLHGLDAGQALTDVHPAQERLIEAGLEFVRRQKDLELVGVEGFLQDAAPEVGVQGMAGLGERVGARFLVLDLARERHERPDAVAPFLDVLVDRELPPHDFLSAPDDHHRLGLSIQERRDVLPKMLDHHLNLLGDVVRMEPDPAHDPLQGRATLDFLVVILLPIMGQTEGQLVRGVVLGKGPCPLKSPYVSGSLYHR